VWCDRRPLISEEIDEHIWDGQKIWDPEFSGDPVPSCRRPKVALVRLHIVELTEFFEIRYRIAGVPLPSLSRREANRGGFFCGPSIPNKSQDFTLVSAGGGRKGVVHAGGVNHGDMCLITQHGQIHPEFLDIDHELAERRPICQVARGSP
jgi:hypothetical protein